MAFVFLTGFPGFLGSELIGKILDRHSRDASLVCLVQTRFLDLARRRITAMERMGISGSSRIILVEGDITLPGLGLGDDARRMAAEIAEIFHLAAVYDLAVKRAVGMRINVEGTRNVLAFAKECPHLKRFHYVSTCYVSGRYDGQFDEDDLIKGQSFNNFYEESKYLAEVAVQKAMQEGLPATIYRPAIVVGNSQSGATQKYDGLYYIIQWILRQPRIAVMPVIGNPKKYFVNVVPSDFIVEAISYLSGLEKTCGRVYQLSDPDPLTVDGLLNVLEGTTDRNILRFPMTKSLAKGALKYIPGVYQLMRIEPEAVSYFVHPTRYGCRNTLEDLAGSGISCPPFPSYARQIVKFMQDHPDISSSAMA